MPKGIRTYSSATEELHQAQNSLQSLAQPPDNVIKLKLYGLFKQATVGKNDKTRPVGDPLNEAKWDAWHEACKLTSEEAKTEYVSLIKELTTKDTKTGAANAKDEEPSIRVTTANHITTITLNRPKKFNAINFEMYSGIQSALADASSDPDTTLAVLTGSGKFYSSGNDLDNFKGVSPSEFARIGSSVLKAFVGSFIDFPKAYVTLCMPVRRQPLQRLSQHLVNHLKAALPTPSPR